jgi:hypothetical protein
MLALDEVTVLAATHARPGHAEVRKLADGNARFLGKDPRHFLVRTPVGTTHGIEEMQRRVVAFGLDAIAERGLHAALCCTAVAATRWHQREDQDVVTRRGRLDRGAFAGQSTTDNQHVRTDD